MKRTCVVALMTAVSLFGGLAEVTTAQTVTVSKENRVLEVSGMGTASAEPDVAKVHVGFSTYGATLSEAYSIASERSSSIVKALLTAGATKGAIESQSQSVQALSEYELKNLPSSLKGMKYRAGQSWTVRVEPAQVAKIIDVAVQAGADQTGQVDWMMKDSTQLERDAVARATARATALAEEMATGLKVKLGALVYATTETQSTPFPVRNAVAMFAKGASDQAQPLSIEAQRVERSVTVRAFFAIE